VDITGSLRVTRRRSISVNAKRLVLAVLAIAAVLPAAALGSKVKLHEVAATPAQRAAIVKAFGDPPKAEPCLIVRLAASNRNYGTVRPRIIKRCRRWQFNGVNVIKRVRDGHWRVVFEGSAFACPVRRILHQVQRDLGVCP